MWLILWKVLNTHKRDPKCIQWQQKHQSKNLHTHTAHLHINISQLRISSFYCQPRACSFTRHPEQMCEQQQWTSPEQCTLGMMKQAMKCMCYLWGWWWWWRQKYVSVENSSPRRAGGGTAHAWWCVEHNRCKRKRDGWELRRQRRSLWRRVERRWRVPAASVRSREERT